MKERDAPGSCEQADLVYGFAVGALSAAEAAQFAVHLAKCNFCSRTLDTLRPVIASFVGWPSDVLRPSPLLWNRLSARIDGATDANELAVTRAPSVMKLEWQDVAPGISCKLLATDVENERISMLVRLAPGAEYPPHRHAGHEELHLLDGELMINERKLYPGDYNRAEAGSVDSRVWSKTGCTCVLITSLLDELR